MAAGLSFANTLYGLLILPESLPKDRRSPFHWRNANPLGALRLLASDTAIAGLSVVTFISQVAHVVLPSTFVPYTTYRYGWDEKTVGLTLAMVGVCSTIVQGAAVGPIVARFGERRTLIAGMCFGAAGFLLLGLAPTGPVSWLGIPLTTLWGIAGAATQSLMTQRVAPDHQGQMQGATNSVQSVEQLVGPFLFTLTFAYFIGKTAPWVVPGDPFIVASLLLVLALAAAIPVLSAMRRNAAVTAS